MRQLWWSLLALALAVGFGIWTLDFTGVLNLRAAALAQLRRIPGMADYITAYQQGKAVAQAQQQMEAKLAEREQQLAARAKELDQRAAELDRMARELEARRAQLDQREAALSRREQALSSAEERQRYYRELAEAVGQMRPEEAARVIEQLEPELARRLLGSMDPRQAGAIMGRMDPRYAGQLLAALGQVLAPASGGSGKAAGM